MKNTREMDDSLQSMQKTTIRLAINAQSIKSPAAQRALVQAAEVLHAGGTVAFPTETVYGLGANALDAEAVQRIFEAKQRPAWDPLIVHVSGAAMLSRVAASVPAHAQKLIDAFWPGPLTLLLPKHPDVPDMVTAGRPLVGVRVPAHPVALELIQAADIPIAAPSANRFGHTSPTTAQHVLDDLDGRIDMVLDGGSTSCGVESTVIEARERETILYRPGAISLEQLQAIAGDVLLYQAPDHQRAEALPSPGVGIRHYAPNAIVVPIDVDAQPESDQQSRWVRVISQSSFEPTRSAVMLPTGWPLPEGFSGRRYEWGSWHDDRILAQRLFAGLRTLDDLNAAVIFCPLPANTGLGAAVRDRILKAAREA
jgi:L-threonylcarbamoyladenylate synthase